MTTDQPRRGDTITNDIGPVVTITLPTHEDIAAMDTQHKSLAFSPAADTIRHHLSTAAVWFDSAHLAIRQTHSPDVVAVAGDQLVIAVDAAEVWREAR